MPVSFRFCWIVVALLAALLPGAAAFGQSQAPRNLIAPTGTELRTLDQHWTSDDANWFYNVPQGSKLLPYTWFLHLEQPDIEGKLLRDPAHIQALGYLARTTGPDNPDGLPVGFVKDDNHLGLTCAACHTGLMTYKGRSWLIDGAPTLGDVSRLQREIATALEQTQTGAKFERFAKNVIGPSASDADKAQLKKDLAAVLKTRSTYNTHNLPAKERGTPFGPGRVDAFGAILNQVTTQIAGVPGNAQAANAPVSYPFLWDTPHHDRVQWNGAAKNARVPLLAKVLGTEHVGALGRNTGEVLGVFGQANAQVNELLLPRGYSSSVKTANLIQIEETVRKLQSPVWPAEFGLIDEALRSAGEALFEKHCAACHHDIRRDDENRRVVADMRAVGTDQTMAANFATHTARPGLFAGRLIKIPGLDRFSQNNPEPVSDFLVHAVQRVLLGAHKDQFAASLLAGSDLNYSVAAEVHVADTKLRAVFRDLELKDGKLSRGTIVLSDEPSDLLVSRDGHTFQLNQQSLQDKVRLLHDKVQEWDLHKLVTPDIEITSDHRIVIHLKPVEEAKVVFAYKGRPLNGIWATAPYLHNGSVPSLDELLKPAAQRVKKFGVGSREFDPEKVGYKTDTTVFEFDTALPGNSNSGHEYGSVVFTEAERKQLIEYMKSL